MLYQFLPFLIPSFTYLDNMANSSTLSTYQSRDLNKTSRVRSRDLNQKQRYFMDYLKRYLEPDRPSKRIKHRKKNEGKDSKRGMVIVDDNSDDVFKAVDDRSDSYVSLSPRDKFQKYDGAEKDESEFAPQIVSNIPVEVAGLGKSTKMKRLGVQKPDNAIKSTATDNTNLTNGIRMESGAKAGLQKASQVRADLEERRKQQLDEIARQKNDKEAQTTIYRDASGRVIDIALIKEEAHKKKLKKEQEVKKSKELAGGLVQQKKRLEQQERLEQAKSMPFAIYKDDKIINAELKQRSHWNDPGKGIVSKQTSRSRRPVYEGYAPTNRFGIEPGYRWDGVDRGNGFEEKFFVAINERANRDKLAYAWSTDDM